MKKIIFLIILLVFFSCKDEKIEFIQSKAIKSLFLIKNHSKSKDEYKMFYKYSSNTKSFLDDERPGGYFRGCLDQYAEDQFATFTIEPCEMDSTKLLGRLYFYGLK
ncbi:hypothetical protein [Chryseobacterium sp.]|jgi:hypothetical protein|uniref:hypothetical protein n=1 Tax=Chryseobacterium sp. TaxID=1871047 RepID=UPI00284C0CC7|nr:hypothetical protein [Chryseobacterium sp.]MDR3025154.1 hypothetical protein [Chryseobacterium sp.]